MTRLKAKPLSNCCVSSMMVYLVISPETLTSNMNGKSNTVFRKMFYCLFSKFRLEVYQRGVTWESKMSIYDWE